MNKSLSHFRKRCYDYESVYGVDLLHNCIIELEKSLKEAKEEGDEARAKRLKSTLDRLK